MSETERSRTNVRVRRKAPPHRRRPVYISEGLRLPVERESALCKLRCARDWLDAAESLLATSPQQRDLWRREWGKDPELLRAACVLGEWGAPEAIGTALESLIVMAAEARALLDADEEVEVDVEFRANAVPGASAVLVWDCITEHTEARMTDLSYRSPKTEVRPSAIHGKGLFAREPIAADEIAAVKGGYVLDAARWAELEAELGSAEIQIAEDFFIAPVRQAEREGSMLYTNHSCDPNLAIEGQIVFVALRDIVAGEELTHDWVTTDDLDYTIECRCGSAQCRGTITGRDWMKPKLQAKYRGHFAWHVQRRIDRLTGGGAV